jgi:hypothetical protein
MNFEYEDQLLKKIVDPVGKEFVFEYDELNRIQALYDKTTKRTITYSYGDNGDLEEVDSFLEPDLIAGTEYNYLGIYRPFELQHNLTEIINPNGESVLDSEYGHYPGTWEYNRVVRQRSLDGEYRYEYGPVNDSSIVDPAIDPINLPQTFTRIFYPNGHSVEHRFNAQGNVVRKTEQFIIGTTSIPEDLVASYRYNEDALLLQEVRPDGAVVEYHYQREVYAELHDGDTSSAIPSDWLAFGNLLKRVERPRTGLGETRRIVTDYTYYVAGNRLASQRGPYHADVLLNPLPGQTIGEVHYDYDTHRNLVKIINPDVLRPDGTVQSLTPTEYVYDNHGLITDVIIGTFQTRYIYFSDTLRSGFVKQKIEDLNGVRRLTQYDVDDIGRVKQIIANYGAITEMEWTTFDTPKHVTLPEVSPGTGGPTISYRYDRNRQLIQVVKELKLHDGTPHTDGSLVQTFRYDPYGRLVKEMLGPAANPNSRKRESSHPSDCLSER